MPASFKENNRLDTINFQGEPCILFISVAHNNNFVAIEKIYDIRHLGFEEFSHFFQ